MGHLVGRTVDGQVSFRWRVTAAERLARDCGLPLETAIRIAVAVDVVVEEFAAAMEGERSYPKSATRKDTWPLFFDALKP